MGMHEQGWVPRVGDRVRIRATAKYRGTDKGKQVGKCGRISELAYSSMCRVQVDDCTYVCWWDCEELEPAPDAAADPFPVGTHVRMVRADDEGWEAYHKGESGVICSDSELLDDARLVRFDDGDEAGIWAKNLERVDASEEVMGIAGKPKVFHSFDEYVREFGGNDVRADEIAETINYYRQRISAALGIPAELMVRVAHPEPPRETWSADLVLADGRAVTLPGPDPSRWDLVEERRIENQKRARTALASILISGDSGEEFLGGDVKHDEGRCWLADMSRFVNETRAVSPFEVRWAYATVLRRWRERPSKRECYSDSILAKLW